MVREMNEHRELIEKYLLGWGVFLTNLKSGESCIIMYLCKVSGC